MRSAAAADRRPSRKEAAGYVGGLFERHARMVYGVCRAMLRDVHEAEDATQQVFLSAHRALLAGAAVRDPAGWLATIARNECRARIAAGMRRPLPVADADLDMLPTVRDEQAQRSQLEELRTALAQLPERQREAVVLRYFYGLRYGEVATALGLSRPATEALLFRARRALRLRLRPLVGAALVVPSVVREELALALPGFGGSAGAGAAAVGVTGGLLTKLTAGPVGVKVATSAVAISTVGAVGAVPSEPVHRPEQRPAVAETKSPPVERAQSAAVAAGEAHADEVSAGSSTSGSDRSGPSHGVQVDDRSGPGSGSGESRGDRSGPSEPDSASGRAEPVDEDDSSGPSEPPVTQASAAGAPGDAEADDGNSGPGSADSHSLDGGNSGGGSSGEGGGSSGELGDGGGGSSGEDSGSSGPSD